MEQFFRVQQPGVGILGEARDRELQLGQPGGETRLAALFRFIPGSEPTLEGEPADLFADTPERLWARVLRRQPGELAWVSTAPLDPTMN